MLQTLFNSFLVFFFIGSVLSAPIPRRNSDQDLTPSRKSAKLSAKRAENGALFPVAGTSAKWTTFEGATAALPLDESTLRPQHVASEVPPVYGEYQGKPAIKAHYPAGSYSPSADAPRGGLSFYAPGTKGVDLTTAKEGTFGYSVFFPEGFDFVRGGKLPGFYGGDSEDEAVGCSGGSRSTKCFSIRLMWRTDGAGEFYTYLPPYSATGGKFVANKKVCDVPPFSECNETYGASVGRGSFKFELGKWTTVSERVRLNDEGEANGEIELFVGGMSVINVSGLVLRDGTEGRLRGLMVQTFFGGSDSSWATPKDQDVFFADFSIAITKMF